MTMMTRKLELLDKEAERIADLLRSTKPTLEDLFVINHVIGELIEEENKANKAGNDDAAMEAVDIQMYILRKLSDAGYRWVAEGDPCSKHPKVSYIELAE